MLRLWVEGMVSTVYELLRSMLGAQQESLQDLFRELLALYVALVLVFRTMLVCCCRSRGRESRLSP